MRSRRMAAVKLGSSLILPATGADCHQQEGVVTVEIKGLIKIYKDGHVERPPIVSCVTATTLSSELGVTTRDIAIDQFTNIWARIYVPKSACCGGNNKLPLLVYFHGGGFCVGSAAWSCYHEFLARLAATAGCVIMSVNYRLAPENRLPAAYEDGINAVMWLRQQQALIVANDFWSRQCNFSNIFIGGDSAGANIAYNVAKRLSANTADEAGAAIRPLTFKGTILIQPFFGGEARTNSEKCLKQSHRSALSLAASDTYWQLALPCWANRDHPWCNPLQTKGSSAVLKLDEELKLTPAVMVCISELDILRDRNLEFVAALARAGIKRVEHVVHKGVGHAFQVLSRSHLSQTRTLEMMSQIKDFMVRNG